MPEIMARVEAEDFDRWLQSHRAQAGQRCAYGMTDGPIYRDVDSPNAAFVHIHVEDLARAGQWFRTGSGRTSSWKRPGGRGSSGESSILPPCRNGPRPKRS